MRRRGRQTRARNTTRRAPSGGRCSLKVPAATRSRGGDGTTTGGRGPRRPRRPQRRRRPRGFDASSRPARRADRGRRDTARGTHRRISSHRRRPPAPRERGSRRPRRRRRGPSERRPDRRDSKGPDKSPTLPSDPRRRTATQTGPLGPSSCASSPRRTPAAPTPDRGAPRSRTTDPPGPPFLTKRSRSCSGTPRHRSRRRRSTPPPRQRSNGGVSSPSTARPSATTKMDCSPHHSSASSRSQPSVSSPWGKWKFQLSEGFLSRSLSPLVFFEGHEGGGRVPFFFSLFPLVRLFL
mmetsp:Transcript_7166/g.23532  ORF Transcript_7166/g.23532 Transcript_7166/m.23532 type:complete len:294 (+) Transcript_7166:737-1618(+)